MRLRFPSWVAKSIIASLLLPLWIAEAGAVPVGVSFTASPATILVAGDSLTVTARLDDAVLFDTLDAALYWDNQYLAPVDQVSASPFLTLGGVFAGTDFTPASYNSTPGSSSFNISLVSPSFVQGSGPGDLFSLNFQVRDGVALPSSTPVGFGSIGSLPGDAFYGVGLLLQLVFDQNGPLDTALEYTATPAALSIPLFSPPPPTPPLPEPATSLLWLAGLIAMGRFGAKR